MFTTPKPARGNPMVMATGREETGMTAGHVTRAAGILIQLVKVLAAKLSPPSSQSESYVSVVEFNSRQLKVPKGGELPCNRPQQNFPLALPFLVLDLIRLVVSRTSR